MKKIPLHLKILIGILLGLVFGFAMTNIGEIKFSLLGLSIHTTGNKIVQNWVQPFGQMFIKSLKLIAIPLILGSLIKGISDLKDISKFATMGVKTMVTYIVTTVIAITIGLSVVNIFKPGEGVVLSNVNIDANSKTSSIINNADKQTETGPLQFLVDVIPDNIFKAMSNNSSMLQVIFFTVFLGICLLLIEEKQAKPLKDLFDSLNEAILKMVDVIMLTAPLAVFSLIATLIATTKNPDLLISLLKYAGVVLLGLIIMVIVYMIIIAVYVKKSPIWFLKQISPAQLLAFSTSSSAATLPVTMERVEEHIGVDKEVASFVLPVGATINMDGSSLYQAVASIFLLQIYWPEGATLANQFTILISCLFASIGAAAVPGAALVMLVVGLKAIGFPDEYMEAALSLVFVIDRPLDMLRTTVNVTGDATVSTVIAKSFGKLNDNPQTKNWDDNTENI